MKGFKWIFFDVGTTLVDERDAYDSRVRDMIEGTEISFEEFDSKRIEFAKQGREGHSSAIRFFGLAKTPLARRKGNTLSRVSRNAEIS